MLNQPLHFYIPEFQARDVTAWNLLTHTSRLASNIPFADMIKTRSTAQDYLERAYRSDVLFEPGSQVAYTQQAFYVLADLITRLGGLLYPAYQHRYLFEPLGMCDTSYDPTGAPGRFEWLSSHNTIPNEQIPLTREEWTRYSASIASPAFGLWSTASDLVTLGQALLGALLHGDTTILAPSYVELMTRDHTVGIAELVNGKLRPAHRGLGWGKNNTTLPGSPRVFKHGGSEAGLLWIDPDWDLIYVFLGSRGCQHIECQFLPLDAVYGALQRRMVVYPS